MPPRVAHVRCFESLPERFPGNGERWTNSVGSAKQIETEASAYTHVADPADDVAADLGEGASGDYRRARLPSVFKFGDCKWRPFR